uniref:Uncharacterized protein n=1 Tax=Pyxicephalus adspersus TaxID=30357 RepID=A0AAV3A7P7_PYXAD|nr:TPA: hypothetical protein GDO54_014528 [Pyxicephalus adspersus]
MFVHGMLNKALLPLETESGRNICIKNIFLMSLGGYINAWSIPRVYIFGPLRRVKCLQYSSKPLTAHILCFRDEHRLRQHIGFMKAGQLCPHIVCLQATK